MALHYDIDEGVAVLTLDRQETLNAFDDELGKDLLDALQEASVAPSVRCVAITGAGRAFSSGEDLNKLSEGYARGEPPDLGRILSHRYNPLVRTIRSLPKPVVAAVNGVAAGAGAAVALACDTRIAAESAKLVFPFAKVGLIPDSGSLWLLARMVGASRAWDIVSSGRTIDAHEAQELGLFSRIAPSGRFEAVWRGFARELAEGPPIALRLTKQLLSASLDRNLDDQLEAETEAQDEAGRSADHLEGVRAFQEKRPARFTGA